MTDLNRSILVCPMNWGLGHATRCIPVIRALSQSGARVTIAASGNSLALLNKEFPELDSFEFPGFSPRYPRNRMFALKMLLHIPSFIYYILYENYQLSKVLKVRKFDAIISDNRYGLFNKKIKSIIIIHQLNILPPAGLGFLQPLIRGVNYFLISRFDECWIPDNRNEPFVGGELSHPSRLPGNARFIGPLSRFSKPGMPPENKDGFLLVLLSGQEPQRTLLENKIISQLSDYPAETLLIRGRTRDTGPEQKFGNIRCIPYADSKTIESLFGKARLVICRSGYSGIMDLHASGGKALFIPTPGQTEQEYLARYYYQRGIALFVGQEDMDLKNDVEQALRFRGFTGSGHSSALQTAIDFLMGKQ